MYAFGLWVLHSRCVSSLNETHRVNPGYVSHYDQSCTSPRTVAARGYTADSSVCLFVCVCLFFLSLLTLYIIQFTPQRLSAEHKNCTGADGASSGQKTRGYGACVTCVLLYRREMVTSLSLKYALCA